MPLLLSPGPEFISAPIFLGFHSGFTVSRQTFSSHLSLLHCISFETSRERERERQSSAKTIKKYAQKFLFQQLQSNRSILEKFWQRWTNTRPSFERERERERQKLFVKPSNRDKSLGRRERDRDRDKEQKEIRRYFVSRNDLYRTLHYFFLLIDRTRARAKLFHSPFIPLITVIGFVITAYRAKRKTSKDRFKIFNKIRLDEIR